MRTYWLHRWFGAPEGDDALGGHPEGVAAEAGTSVWQFVDSSGALASELARARRYERDFSVVVVSQNLRNKHPRRERTGTNGRTPPEKGAPGQVSLEVAAAGLREAIRESDVLCYEPAYECFVLGLIDSDEDAARDAVRRVRMLFSARLDVDLSVGVAHFPTDRLTLDDLMEAARGRAASSVTPEPGVDHQSAGDD